MQDISTLTTTAESISNLGVLVVIAAMFLLLSGGMLFACFKWFQKIINNIIDKNEHMMNQLVYETRNQNKTLMDISESLRPADLLQIQFIINQSFENSISRVCRLVQDVVEENNIKDRETTKKKIHVRVNNLYNQITRDYNLFHYGSYKLSEYMDSIWVEKVSEAVEKEIYHEIGTNPERTYAMIKATFEAIKSELYSKMIGV